MFDEKELKIILGILASISLVFLYFYSYSLTERPVKISEINPEMLGKVVKACGEINNLYISKNGHIFFKLFEENSSIKCVIFNSTASKINKELKEKENICVLGKINEWKDELEIVVSGIEEK